MRLLTARFAREELENAVKPTASSHESRFAGGPVGSPPPTRAKTPPNQPISMPPPPPPPKSSDRQQFRSPAIRTTRLPRSPGPSIDWDALHREPESLKTEVHASTLPHFPEEKQKVQACEEVYPAQQKGRFEENPIAVESSVDNEQGELLSPESDSDDFAIDDAITAHLQQEATRMRTSSPAPECDDSTESSAPGPPIHSLTPKSPPSSPPPSAERGNSYQKSFTVMKAHASVDDSRHPESLSCVLR